MDLFLQYIVQGIFLGVTYGLIAVPLGLAHSAHGIVDAAVGGYAALAGIVALAIGGAVGVMAGLGVGVAAALVVAVIYRLLVRRGASDPVIVVAATFGVGLAIESIILTQFGKDARIHRLFTDSVDLGPVFIDPQYLINLATGVVLVAAVIVLLYKSTIGRQIRAAADNKAAALLAGVSVTRLQYLVFILEGLLAGVAGILLAYTVGLDFTSAVTLTLNAFGAAIIFGMRGPLACFAGGIVIGVIDSLVAGYVSGGMLTALPFIVVIGVLILMPRSTLVERP
ncbi:branched-chain amino acid ABC transporter permease [Gordonia hydrophobica]|uniref:Branched-chain amino acid ABC transporter permease n=1 Tax=Gordonia hydrophobica TaxID=40516 RepID=A0ABZ2U7H8_9ACTN|nr:branched-chain amino acid ABC transporter permease [Gordonia hydrophobica]MBM7368649.1 branched-chain amino acid transport system permease protein [Gordonia hydrophobica]